MILYNKYILIINAINASAITYICMSVSLVWLWL